MDRTVTFTDPSIARSAIQRLQGIKLAGSVIDLRIDRRGEIKRSEKSEIERKSYKSSVDDNESK